VSEGTAESSDSSPAPTLAPARLATEP